MLTYNDFKKGSTDCDYELFFNPDYQRVVNNAIQELEKKHHWKNVKGWRIFCYETIIQIENRKTKYVSLLDPFNKTAAYKNYCVL